MPIQNYSLDYLTALVEGLYQKTNTPLPRSEFDTLRRLVDEERTNAERQKAWLRPQDGRIDGRNLDLPLVSLYNNTLEKNTASITIRPPAKYNTLIIAGSGSVDVANGGNIWAELNGDTGAANYAYQYISGVGATAGAAEDTSFHGCVLGVFGTTGAGAGVNGSFLAHFPGYSSVVWKKNVISHAYTAEFNDQYLAGSTWANTSPITSIEMFGTDNTLAKGTANLLSGSYFSVWAL